MLKVGITGGIGSGKTTVCRIFEALGIPVFYADNEAKKLYDDPTIRNQVREMFGPAVITDGTIDKKKLASLVFSDKPSLQKLNNLIHPVVSSMYNEWSLKYPDKPYVIEEAALLFESGIYKRFDINILVIAPLEIRINRIIQRDNTTREAVIQRIDNQMNEEEKKLLANKIIVNDGSVMVMPQVAKLHSELVKNL